LEQGRARSSAAVGTPSGPKPTAHPSLATLLDEAEREYDRRCALGHEPPLPEFVRGYPRIAARLHRRLQFQNAARAIERDWNLFPVVVYVAPSEKARRQLVKWGIRTSGFVFPHVRKAWLKGLRPVPEFAVKPVPGGERGKARR